MILGVSAFLLSFFLDWKFHHLRSEVSPHQHPSREKSKYTGPLQLGIAILYNGLLSQHLSTWYIERGEPFRTPKWLKKKTITLLFVHNVRCFFLPNKGKTVNKRDQKQRNERVTCCIISLRLCWTCLKAGNWAKMGDVVDATQLQKGDAAMQRWSNTII